MYSFKVGCVHGANFWLNIIQNAAATQHSNMVTNLEVQHTEGLGMELVAIHEFSENWTHTEIMAPQQSPNEQNYSCQRSQLCKCWCPKIKSYTLKTKIHQKKIYQFKTIYARGCQTKKSSLDKSKYEKMLSVANTQINTSIMKFDIWQCAQVAWMNPGILGKSPDNAPIFVILPL